MRYIYPRHEESDGAINRLGLPRLFAYPHVPKTDSFFIMDSGAYALSIRKQKMTTSHMVKLSAHYAKYYRDNCICIAPDEFKNPFVSMRNWAMWHASGLFEHITPVIQATKNYSIELTQLFNQVDFYTQSRKVRTMCFSNNGLRGEDAKAQRLYSLFHYMRRKGVQYIHVLGAGWGIDDIKKWQQVGGWDSMDSIAYYTNPADYGASTPLEAVERIEACFQGLNT